MVGSPVRLESTDATVIGPVPRAVSGGASKDLAVGAPNSRGCSDPAALPQTPASIFPSSA